MCVGLSPGLGQRPQPGYIDVGVSDGGDIHIQGWTSAVDTLL